MKFNLINKKETEVTNNAAIKAYWKLHKELEGHCELWACLSGDKPLYYILLKPIEPGPNEKLSPWIEEGLPYYWIDVVPLSKAAGSKEKLVELFTAWLEFCDGKKGLLADPDVKDEKRVEALDLSHFKRVGSLIKGEGFFKGSSHHVMRHP